jgi:bacterioferritin-associated ferredoxin
LSVLTAFRERVREMVGASQAPAEERDLALVCHCRGVSRGTVTAVIRSGEARSLADVQRQTTACTRCFGCRFDLERMLRAELGESYRPTPFLTRPEGLDGAKGRTLPRRMYMPVFSGYRGHGVTTRVVIFNWADEADVGSRPVKARADLLAMDGTRLGVWETTIEPRCSAVLDGREIFPEGLLREGVGVFKLVVDSRELGSLRPYFQLVTPTSVSSTHEKTGPHKLDRGVMPRRYNFLFPIAPADRPEEVYFFCTNTEAVPMERQELVWRSEDGEEDAVAVPRIELDQSACIPLHEAFPAIASGRGRGTVRLEPPLHKVAGFMLRVDTEAALWKVQHL